ncbi:MAG: helix-turn-helix transcriptional regulator [Ferrovibrio sp.]
MISSASDIGLPAGLAEAFCLGFLRDDALLQQALTSLSRYVGAESGQIAIRLTESDIPILRYIHGVPDDYRLINGYDAYYCCLDPFFLPLKQPENLGEILYGDLVEQDGAGAATFYEQYRKTGWRYILSCAFYNAEGRVGYLRFLRGASAGPFDVGRAAQLKRLLPHIGTAYRMREAFSQVYAPLEQHLLHGDKRESGIIYLDASSRIVMVNDRARRIFASMDGLYLKAGTVEAGGWEETKAVEKLVANAIAVSRVSDSLPIQREISVSRPSTRAPYSIQVVPVVVRNRFTDENAIVAALRILDQGSAQLDDAAAAYKLTAAEARLAQYLIAGMPPKEVARQTGLSVHTIRTQQRGLYRKLGVSRHYDMLMRLAPNRIG